MDASRPPAADARPEWPLMLGGLLFATGAVVLFFRKSSSFASPDTWGDFPLLLVLLVPCALLFALAARDAVPGAPPAPWQSVFLVYAVLLLPLALFQFVALVDGNTDDSLNVAWIFLLTAAAAGVASFRLGASYQALLMGLALIVVWLSFWDKVLDDPSTNTSRWLLVIVAGGLLAGAVVLRGGGRPQGSELVTAAGVAGVLAGALGGVVLASGLAAQLLTGESEASSGTGWDILLVVVSAGLIAYAASQRVRGPAYVGAAGLLIFMLLVGSELGTLAEGDEAEGKLVGWPLLLLLLGGAALAAGLAGRRPPAGAAPAAAATGVAVPQPPPREPGRPDERE